MKSILQSKRECFVCGQTYELELHHIYAGKNRKNSDEHGFTVWLCARHHRGTSGVHGRDGSVLDEILKARCQKRFEETHKHSEFMKIIGKNYL